MVVGAMLFAGQAVTPSGWMGWLAVPMANAMEWLYGYIPNYGWVVVLLALTLRILLWPLQSQTNRNRRLMREIAPLQKEIKERNQGNRAQIQRETTALYKEYGLNPSGGCLLLLILVALCLGLADCRTLFQNQSWLWVDDLSRADTVIIFGLPIDPLALLIALTLFGISWLTPLGNFLSNPWKAAVTALMTYFVFNNCIAAVTLAWTTNNLVVFFQAWLWVRKVGLTSEGGVNPPNADPS